MNASIRPRNGAALCVIALSLSAAGCTQVSGAGTKAGGEAPPLTLRIGTNDTQGRTASNQIEEFARQVDQRSDGSIVVEPTFDVGGAGTPAWDQVVAGQVADGELDGGVIPARAWDLLGVDSLRALNTPFLITSDQLMNDVVRDEDLARDLMSGLDEAGVTGLALLPEELRHLFVFDRPGVRLADLRDRDVRAPRSATTWALFDALGAKPTDGELEEGFAAAETSYGLANTLPRATAVMGNLTFYPKINSLVINDERFDDLTGEQQQVLREAALATRDWAISTNPGDAQRAKEYCEGGGTVVTAEETELTALRRAADPVIADLREDSMTADLIDRIEAMGDPADAEAVRPCAGSTASSGAVSLSSIVADGGNLPEGTYRVEFTDQYLRSQGLSTEDIGYNRGVWTVVLNDGQWSVEQVAPAFTDRFAGIYQVKGEDLYWRFYEGEPGAHVTWKVDDAGDLHFEWVAGPPDAEFHFATPWRRVG